MWSEPELVIREIPAAEQNYNYRSVLQTKPGNAYRVVLTMEDGDASGCELWLWDKENRSGTHRQRVEKNESIEFAFTAPPESDNHVLLVYPEGIGKTAGHSARIRAEIQTASVDDLYPKVTFGIDTGIGVSKVKDFIENILRQNMKDFEILIYCNPAHEGSQHSEDSLYTDVDSRIRFIDDSPQESWIDVAIREAREEYLMLIDETTQSIPVFNIGELALITSVSPDFILLNEASDSASLGLTASDGGIYEVADLFQFIKSLQAEKTCPVLMRKSFVQAWLSNDLLPTPSAYSLDLCAAVQAETIACLPVQSWLSWDDYALPKASLVADELSWINCQLNSYSSSGKVTLLLSELKRYATCLAAILGATIDAKAESRFLALTGSYTSLLRVTTSSQESFIKACKTVTTMIENTFNNMLESHSYFEKHSVAPG